MYKPVLYAETVIIIIITITPSQTLTNDNGECSVINLIEQLEGKPLKW